MGCTCCRLSEPDDEAGKPLIKSDNLVLPVALPAGKAGGGGGSSSSSSSSSSMAPTAPPSRRKRLVPDGAIAAANGVGVTVLGAQVLGALFASVAQFEQTAQRRPCEDNAASS